VPEERGLGFLEYHRYCRLLGIEPAAGTPAARAEHVPAWLCPALVATEGAEANLRAWAAATPDVCAAQTPDAATILAELDAYGDEFAPHLIAGVLAKLPAPVVAYVRDAVTFVAVGYAVLGFAGPAPPPRPWQIVLGGLGDDAERFERLVAHEAAHVWLIHAPIGPLKRAFYADVIRSTPMVEVPPAARARVEAHRRAEARDERQAIALAAAWGFAHP
jgi:hypothetical protein